MTSRTTLPLPDARVDDLVITATTDEVLIYDQRSHQLHHLNPLATVIWRLCDGQRTLSAIARAASVTLRHPVAADTAVLALQQLEDADLLDGPGPAGPRPPRQTRRSLLRKAALAGTAPVVVSVLAPTAASAQSPPTCTGTPVIDCRGQPAGQCCVGFGFPGACNNDGSCIIFPIP